MRMESKDTDISSNYTIISEEKDWVDFTN